MEIVIVWLLLAAGVGFLADSRGRSGIGFFLLSAVLSPLLGLIVALVTTNVKDEERKEQSRREEHERQLASISAIAGTAAGQTDGMASKKAVSIDTLDLRPARVSSPPEQPRLFSVADELEKLASLKDRGLLSLDEYQQQKSALLRGAP